MKTYTSSELTQLGRQIVTPFLIEIYREGCLDQIKIIEILRIIPRKRLVAKANWQGTTVIVKIFFAPLRWKRNLSRDISGIILLRKNGLRAPAILHEGELADKKGAALVLEFVEDGKTVGEYFKEAESASEQQLWFSKTVRAIGVCHRSGLWQSDLHMDNFIQSKNHIYYLDGGGIRVLEDSSSNDVIYRNIALFLAQFKVENDENIGILLKEYCLENQKINNLNKKLIADKVREARILRISNYEKKLFRSTTAHRNIRSISKFVVHARDIYSSSFESFVGDPNGYIKKECLMKDGNSTTVAEFNFDGEICVIKRYNLKSLWQKIKYLFKPSRAAKCWRNSLMLRMLGVETPRPFIIMEERLFGLLRKKAYFVCEKIEAPNLMEYFEGKQLKHTELAQIIAKFRNLFQIMIDYKISHGDMKASNFIFHNEKLFVLDLDGMKRHQSNRHFKKAIMKDFNRFMKNWRNNEYEEEFKSMIDELEILTNS